MSVENIKLVGVVIQLDCDDDGCYNIHFTLYNGQTLHLPLIKKLNPRKEGFYQFDNDKTEQELWHQNKYDLLTNATNVSLMPTGPRIYYTGKNPEVFQINYKEAVAHGLKFGPLNLSFFKKDLKQKKMFRNFYKFKNKKLFENTLLKYKSLDSDFFKEELELSKNFFTRRHISNSKELNFKLSEKPKDRFKNYRIKFPCEI